MAAAGVLMPVLELTRVPEHVAALGTYCSKRNGESLLDCPPKQPPQWCYDTCWGGRRQRKDSAFKLHSKTLVLQKAMPPSQHPESPSENINQPQTDAILMGIKSPQPCTKLGAKLQPCSALMKNVNLHRCHLEGQTPLPQTAP